MSLFSNDIRVANTATPSFQQKVNVGGFGWTGADQGNYNQLIQYVDECRKIWINLEEKIDYVEGLLVEIQGIDEQVKYITQKSNEVAEDARDVRAQTIYVTVTSQELKGLKAAFDDDYSEFGIKYSDVLNKHQEVLVSASNAKASELGSKGWYDKSYDLYLDLKEGQVYRGTWNPNSGAFPAHQGTNSVWDVILNAGQNEYPYGGFVWRNGDRLLYVVSESKYDQLSTGSGVSSVNGQVGAVTISADSLSVVKRSGDKMLGPLQWGDTNKYVSGSGSNMYVAARSGIVYIEGKENPIARVGSNDYTIYHQGYKPTAGDVGAVNKTGDTMTGELRLPSGKLLVEGVEFVGVSPDVLRLGNQSRTLKFHSKSTDLILTTPTGDNRVYHQGYKPTAADVGALPITGGTLTGNLTVQGNAYTKALIDTATNIGKIATTYTTLTNWANPVGTSVFAKPDSTGGPNGRGGYWKTLGRRDGSSGYAGIWVDYQNGTSDVYIGKNEVGSSNPIWAKVYTDKSKPTAADIGALPITGGVVSGSISWDTDTYVNSVKNALYLASKAGRVYVEGKENPIARVGGVDYVFYHQGYKPTASDVGALVSGAYSSDLNNLSVSGQYLLRQEVTNKPAGASGIGDHIIHQNWDANAAYQIYTEFTESRSGKMWTRNKSGGKWGVWKQVYDTVNKPTASDVGAVARTVFPDDVDLDSLRSGQHFRLTTRYTNGPLPSNQLTYAQGIHVNGGGDTHLQIVGGYDKSRIFWRGFNNSGSAKTGWAEFYTTLNKPTAGDVGALSSTQMIDTSGSSVYYIKLADLNASPGSNSSGVTGIISGGSNYGTSVVPCFCFSASTRGSTGGAATLKMVNFVDGSAGSGMELFSVLNGERTEIWLKTTAYPYQVKVSFLSGSYYNTFPANSTTTEPSGIVSRLVPATVYNTGFKPTAADIGAAQVSSSKIVIPPLSGSPGGTLKNQTTSGTNESWMTTRPDSDTAHHGLGISETYGPQYWQAGTRRKIYHEGFKPTAFDIQVTDPRTKKEETLMEVIASLTARIEELEAKLK